MLESHVRNVVHLSCQQRYANIFCGHSILTLIRVQYFLYRGASSRNRHVLPGLLNQWDRLEQLRLKRPHYSLRRGSSTKEMATLIRVFGLALLCSSFPRIQSTQSLAVVVAHPDVAAVFLESFVQMFMGFSEVFHDSVMMLMCKELRTAFWRWGTTWKHRTLYPVTTVTTK